jgi:DNA-binding transcriptional LysR family regulator
LEQHLGLRLIDRSKRPLVLTPEGTRYYEGCRPIVERYFALEEDIRTNGAQTAGNVRVASIYSIGFSHMNRIVDDFHARYPRAKVRVQYEHPARVYELAETDQVDLGLVSCPRSSRTIDAVHWREEPMVVVCAPTHPLSTVEALSLEDLDGMALVGFDRGLPIRRQVDRELNQHGVEVDYVAEFDNIETIKRAIETGAGLGLLPAPTITRETQSGTLIAIPLAGQSMVRPLGIIFRRGRELTKAASRFIELLHRSADCPHADKATTTLTSVS